MEKQNQKAIKEAIRLSKIWQDFGPGYYPIDLDEIVNGILCSPDFKDGLTVHRKRLESIEGCLVRKEGCDHWTILLNESIKNVRRRRFTFAHELGHFLCHRYLQDRFEDTSASLNNYRDELEFEANVFAAWLLMPANILRSEFERSPWTIETLRAVGNRFESSLQSSGLRYVQLVRQRPVAFVVSRDGMIVWAEKSGTAPFMSSFLFGDELPEFSQAKECADSPNNFDEPPIETDAWHQTMRCIESQYVDKSGLGFQYTCLEFV